MLLARIAPVRLGVDLHTFECEVCDHVLETLTACEDPMQSKIVGRWIQGYLHSPKYPAAVNRLALVFYRARFSR